MKMKECKIYEAIHNTCCGNYSGRNNFMYLLITFGIYLINENILKKISNNIIIHGYFNDFLAPLLLFFWINIWDRNKIARKLYWLIFILACISWEVITPMFKTNSVQDIKDIMTYCIGYIVYLIIEKINENNLKCDDRF
jgi:hypothetical protein